MILANGVLFEQEDQAKILDGLEHQIRQTLLGPQLIPEVTIAACDRLSRQAEAGALNELLARLDLDPAQKDVQLEQVIHLLRRESLEVMVKTQLGKDAFAARPVQPPYYHPGVIQTQRRPLGVLLHIAAGNMDGLPAFTVIEGLLSGNINLLKLPSADRGVSVFLLQRLISEEPRLAPFLYVFDTPSSDLDTLRALACLSDAAVVWGGIGAVSAVRQFAPPEMKLIEWGHRLSFAYLTDGGQTEENLAALAKHIIQTRQMLCSSCQTIFLDWADPACLVEFSKRFLPHLERAAAELPLRETGAVTRTTLSRYTAQLERTAGHTDRTWISGHGCGLVLCRDSELELSPQYGNPLVKCLPRASLAAMLRRHRGVLQTAGLLCAPEERHDLTELLLRAGLNRVTGAGTMSRGTCCDAHDGEYPLQRYTRITEYE